MNEEMEKMMTAIAYETMGIEGYYDLIKESDNVKKEYKRFQKEYGKTKAERLIALSKIHVLEHFLTLKNLKTEDENILIDELCVQARKMYELKED